MNAQETDNIKLSENIIIADGDYIDYVTFQLSVQFERMIERKIPKADISKWIVNIALDGGLRNNGKEHETQVVLIHDAENKKLDNFVPSDYDKDLNAKAFKDEQLGEFIINSYKVEKVINKEDYILDVVKTVTSHDEVKRIMIIPDSEHSDIYAKIKSALRDVNEDKHITLFAMQPMEGGNFKQEILGYSVMNALGIKGDEIK